jgi:hypothetical protein
MGLYSSNCRWFFVCRAVNWESIGQFTSNFTELLELMVIRSVYFMVKFQISIPELWDIIHQIVGDVSYVALSIENPLANSLQISQSYWNLWSYGLYTLWWNFDFSSRVMGLYSSNCRWFFVCRAVNWEPLGQFTSNFTELLELMVIRSLYFMVKFQISIPELWDIIHQIVGDVSYVALSIENPLANSLQTSHSYWNW